MHKGNKYTCPFCNYSSKDLSLIGVDSPISREKNIIGGGKRFGDCCMCGSTGRE